MGLNPSAANGLQSCTDAQFGKGTRNPVACPAASKIGTVAIEDPAAAGGLADRQRLPRPAAQPRPASGEEYRIFVDAGLGPLRGRRAADRQRHRQPEDRPADRDLRRPEAPARLRNLRTVPQVPFTSFKLSSTAAKPCSSSPPTCGPNTDHARS